MTTAKAPLGATFYSSNDNTAIFALSGHTQGKIKILSYKRVPINKRDRVGYQVKLSIGMGTAPNISNGYMTVITDVPATAVAADVNELGNGMKSAFFTGTMTSIVQESLLSGLLPGPTDVAVS